MKKGLKISAAIIGIIIVLLLVLPFMFKDKIIGIVKDEANKMLNAKLEFEDLDISFFSHFPKASIELKNFSLSGTGDFEGDTVYGGIGKGCAVTFVDRKSKLLVGSIAISRERNTIRKAISRAFELMEVPMPIETITLDNGSEFADFLNIEKDLGTTIYFADLHSPWQRGLNENTNDLLRFFYPKGTDFLSVSEEEFQKVIHLINSRPRKCLGYLSPLEFLSKKCCT